MAAGGYPHHLSLRPRLRQVYHLRCPVMILAYILNNLLRWRGKANRSVINLGFGGLLNIVLDPILIFTFDMGISGAAIATLFSQCVSLAILAILLCARSRATSGSAPGSSPERPRCMETS
ncbi:MAG: polysaccharide biosynthesis C-terminal domain-containing protein [Lawsonibacter sp.]